MHVTLNLGAGNDPMPQVEGQRVYNHDRSRHRPEVNSVWDLNDLPWPWGDNTVDLIVARSVFEHLIPDLVQVLDECWRILKPGGQVVLKLPYWDSDVSHQDPTHRWFFTLQSFDQFDPDTQRGQVYGFYTPRKWKIIRPPELNSGRTSIHVALQVRKG